MPKQLLGGSFAPPITKEILERYKSLAAAADDDAIADSMHELVEMVRLFQETPASTLEGTPHDSGRGTVTPLETAEITRIWDAVPWPHECDAMGQLFEQLTGETRDAAYHLLWFARELCLDREPITTDRL